LIELTRLLLGAALAAGMVAIALPEVQKWVASVEKVPNLYLFAAVLAVPVGTLLWWRDPSPDARFQPRSYDVGFGEFFRTVTRKTRVGRLVMWGGAANVGLAAGLFASVRAVPGIERDAWIALCWPLAEYLVYMQGQIRYFSWGPLGRWFNMVFHAGMALYPLTMLLYHLSVLPATSVTTR